MPSGEPSRSLGRAACHQVLLSHYADLSPTFPSRGPTRSCHTELRHLPGPVSAVEEGQDGSLASPLLFSPRSSPSLFSPPHLSPPLLSRVSWSKCSSTELCPAQPRNPASKHPLGHQVPVPCRRSRASCFLWPSCLVFSSSKCGRWHSHRPRWDSAASSSECPPCPSHTASNFWAEFLRKQQV